MGGWKSQGWGRRRRESTGAKPLEGHTNPSNHKSILKNLYKTKTGINHLNQMGVLVLLA